MTGSIKTGTEAPIGTLEAVTGTRPDISDTRGAS
jgi:hypothetical protein